MILSTNEKQKTKKKMKIKKLRNFVVNKATMLVKCHSHSMLFARIFDRQERSDKSDRQCNTALIVKKTLQEYFVLINEWKINENLLMITFFTSRVTKTFLSMTLTVHCTFHFVCDLYAYEKNISRKICKAFAINN